MGFVTDVTWLEHVGVYSQGYDNLTGYDSLTAHKTPRGISMKTYPKPRYRYAVSTEVTEMSGKGMKVVHKSQNSPGYGYDRSIPYPGTGTKSLQKS